MATPLFANRNITIEITWYLTHFEEHATLLNNLRNICFAIRKRKTEAVDWTLKCHYTCTGNEFYTSVALHPDISDRPPREIFALTGDCSSINKRAPILSTLPTVIRMRDSLWASRNREKYGTVSRNPNYRRAIHSVNYCPYVRPLAIIEMICALDTVWANKNDRYQQCSQSSRSNDKSATTIGLRCIGARESQAVRYTFELTTVIGSLRQSIDRLTLVRWVRLDRNAVIRIVRPSVIFRDFNPPKVNFVRIIIESAVRSLIRVWNIRRINVSRGGSIEDAQVKCRAFSFCYGTSRTSRSRVTFDTSKTHCTRIRVSITSLLTNSHINCH